MKEFKVCIRCSTYNHEAFILEALHGFTMQKTDFPFVACIVDDASTDKTQDLIREYFNEHCRRGDSKVETDLQQYVFAQHKENKNCYFAFLFLNENHFCQAKSKEPYFKQWENRADYVAMCEGDDYWTDSTKLQRQVDFLDAHKDFSMCFHRVNVLCEEREKWIFANLKEGEYSARDIYDDWLVPTCSVMYRAYPSLCYSNKKVVFGDIYLWLLLSEFGRFYCLGFKGATYRRHIGGLSVSYSISTYVRLYHQYKYQEKRFPELKDISRRKQETQGLKCIIYAPYFPGIWKYRFLYMLRHPRLFFSSFLTTTILSYTPLRNHKIWKKK